MTDTDIENKKYTCPGTKEEDFGYSFYPDRYKTDRYEKSPIKRTYEDVKESIFSSNSKLKCERSVSLVVSTSPYVKTLIKAMDKAGCQFDPKRHIVCERCDGFVAGGYDPSTNQIVMCKDNACDSRFCEATLAHELVHMYDLCRAKLDFSNLRHIACTEIRAYNLTPCIFSNFFMKHPTHAFPFIRTHKDCVRYKAASSLATSRFSLNMDKALAIVDEVFEKCYGDLEPFGYIPAYGNYEKARRMYKYFNTTNLSDYKKVCDM